MKLLYFSPSSYGGLADYAHAQAEALAKEGVDVTLLCGPDFPSYSSMNYIRLPNLSHHCSAPSPIRLLRAWRMAKTIVENHRRLVREVRNGGHTSVLFGSYAEYFAPLWVGALKRLRGVRWGAVVHDPVRDTVMGPEWWHRRSVAAAYSLLDVAFLHEDTSLKTEQPKRKIQTRIIPHGPYSFPKSPLNRSEARRRLKLPAKATVLLLFGHIRDSKNLDLVLDILPGFPGVHLLVAGKEQSGGQRPAAFYQAQARQKQISDRCHWKIEHIPEKEVALYFNAADFLLLPYNAGFRSASGVLNAAIQFRIPCLATSGSGPLRSSILEYDLGVWRPADDRAALKEGLETLLHHPPEPQWTRYSEENAWSRNARAVIEAFQHLANNRAETRAQRSRPSRLNRVIERVNAGSKL